MRIALFICLLISTISYSQVTISGVTGGGIATDGTTQAFSGGSYLTTSRYIFAVGSRTASGNPSIPTPTSTGDMTFQYLGGIADNFNYGIHVYIGTTAAGGSQDITFTYPETQLDFHRMTAAFNSLTATVRIVTASGTSADPSILSQPVSGSSYLGFFINNKNPFGGTSEVGWTEQFDAGLGTPFGRYATLINNTSDNSMTVTAVSGNWMGVAIQIYSSRRIFNN